MNCKIKDRTVICRDDLVSGHHRRAPNPLYLSNINLLWQMLDLTMRDWQRELLPHQERVDQAADVDAASVQVVQAFANLQPYFLKTLFLYAMFFVSLEEAYKLLYADLNCLNKTLSLRVSHGKPPARSAYIRKVRLIRNVAIAHIGSPRVDAATSIAAASWQPMSMSTYIGEKPNLDRITFGGLKVRISHPSGLADESQDLAIEGIGELDRRCRAYLSKFDDMCADYLDAIHDLLPVIDGSARYYSFVLPTQK